MSGRRRPGRPVARADLVLVPFPFSDLSATKLRPAVVVAADRGQQDFVLAFVSSRNVGRVEPGEVAILPSHPEFGSTGLATASKIRATKLVTVSGAILERWLGRLGSLLIADLDRALVEALEINVASHREEGRARERERLALLLRAGGASAVAADLSP